MSRVWWGHQCWTPKSAAGLAGATLYSALGPHLSLWWDFGCGLACLVPAWFLRLLLQPSNESVNYSISCSDISSTHILLPVCFCCLLLRTLTSIGLGTRGVECYKPRAGKQGAGCVLEVGGGSAQTHIPCWEFENAHFMGEKQRDTLLLPVESWEADCTPLQSFKGSDRKKKFRMLYHWLLLVALSENLPETDKLGLKCSQKAKEEKIYLFANKGPFCLWQVIHADWEFLYLQPWGWRLVQVIKYRTGSA